MDVLVLNAEEVERLLPMDDCIRLMEEALSALGRGSVINPLRSIMRPPEAKGLMGLMPAYQGGAGAAFGLKAVCVFPGNQALGRDTHQGAVLLFSAETGELQALMNASAITAIRTAAVSAVATKHLANPEAGDLGIVGSGVQARWHLEAMASVRRLRRVRVTSRNIENARRLASENRARTAVPIEVVPTVEEAVRGADLIVTATAAREPILRSTWISAGAHLNVVGASAATAREVDTATVERSTLFVDRRESALNEAGDYLLAVKEAGLGSDHIRAELGEVLLGQARGRSGPQEITMFKSVGLAVEDLAAARYLYDKATWPGSAGRRVSY
jgi:ornithine cyclodeaminase/alanine dehydrogenase-like protein (mu-crystallin family)